MEERWTKRWTKLDNVVEERERGESRGLEIGTTKHWLPNHR